MRKLLIFPMLLLSGCMGTFQTTQTVDPSIRTVTISAKHADAMRAALDYCNEKGFAVLSADKELGIINTDFKENNGLSKILLGNYRSKINFSFRQVSETMTRITLLISIEQQGAFGGWTQAVLGEDNVTEAYITVFKGIERYLPPKQGI